MVRFYHRKSSTLSDRDWNRKTKVQIAQKGMSKRSATRNIGNKFFHMTVAWDWQASPEHVHHALVYTPFVKFVNMAWVWVRDFYGAHGISTWKKDIEGRTWGIFSVREPDIRCNPRHFFHEPKVNSAYLYRKPHEFCYLTIPRIPNCFSPPAFGETPSGIFCTDSVGSELASFENGRADTGLPTSLSR